ncbi:hypothetical protein [Maritalea sp.]|uniref:hypothetical protein n=1 Tax=Maritalea sp. TaxID=2003361 RepID=UPI003EF11E92
MADYRELLRRAVDALPENNGMSRRAVYEKAREALVTQLRAIEPPLPAREITQHRLALEDCIRQVEQEATESLLRGLKEETEIVEAPVAVAPTPEKHAEAPEPTVSAVAEPSVEAITEPETSNEAEPETSVEERPSVEEEVTPEIIEMPAPEPLDEADSDEPEPEKAAEVDQPEVDEKSSEEADKPEPVVPLETKSFEPNAIPDIPIEANSVELVEDKTEPETTEQAVLGPSEPENKVVQPIVENNPSFTKEDEAAAKTAVEPKIDVPSVMTRASEPKRSSVDDVIAAAQAASLPREVESPKVELANNSAPNEPAKIENSNVKPALSSVREVDVDEAAQQPVINVDGDEPQAAIDRAIKALDMEAEGKDVSDLVPPSPDGPLKDDASSLASATQKSDTAASKSKSRFKSKASDVDAQVVEDETTGGNGLTVFLLLVVVLLAGAGGGAFWAWKEGFVDLNPLMAQLGLNSQETTEQPTVTTPTETATPSAETVPNAVNVRNITPTSTNTSDVVENTPVATTDERLTTAPEPVVEPVPEVADTTQTDVTPTPEDSAPATPDERLPAEDTETTDVAQPTLNVEDTAVAPVALGSRSMLIEEQVTGSGGAVPFTGSTLWSRDVDELGAPVIKASVSVPARNLSVDVLIRKNSDAALPASHLVEVNFTVTDSFLGGGIASLPGILLKNQELAQGTPLVGASARIFDNSFLFALSAADADLAKNLGLLSDRGWMDFPVVYSTGRKAIVTLEKGADGDAIFEAVLAAWAAQ